MTAAVEEEHLEPDPDALRSVSAIATKMAQYMKISMACSEEGVMAAAEELELHRGIGDWDLEQRAERFQQYAVRRYGGCLLGGAGR